jgi:hypothetical protein
LLIRILGERAGFVKNWWADLADRALPIRGLVGIISDDGAKVTLSYLALNSAHPNAKTTRPDLLFGVKIKHF